MEFLSLWILIILLNNIAVCHYELVIVHVSDIEGRFDEIHGKYYTFCLKHQYCMGGMSRMAYQIKRIRQANENVLFLFPGGILYGSIWNKLLSWNMSAMIINMLEPDAVGTNQLDTVSFGYTRYVRALNNLPLISYDQKDLFGKQIGDSTLIKIGQIMIGIIGTVSMATVHFNQDHEINLKFIRFRIRQLKAQGANIIILMCTREFEYAESIASAEEIDVNVIVLGDKILLWNGLQPDFEEILGPYPVIVQNPFSGNNVAIIAAHGFSKYLGKFHLWFDKNFEVVSFKGNPIFLEPKLPKDQDMENFLNIYRPMVHKFAQQVVGRVASKISSEGCYKDECELGNAITDSYRLEYLATHSCDQFMPITIELALNLRKGFDYSSNGVTMLDISASLPITADVEYGKINASQVYELFEYAVNEPLSDNEQLTDKHSIPEYKGFKWFYQVSGVRVTYVLHTPPMQRVFSLKVQKCDGTFKSIERTGEEYLILYSEHLHQIPGVIDIMINKANGGELKKKNYDVFKSYFQNYSPITAKKENRINFVGGRDDAHSTKSCIWIFTVTVVSMCNNL